MEEPEEEQEVSERMVSDKPPSIMDKLAMYKEQSKAAGEPVKMKEKTEEL